MADMAAIEHFQYLIETIEDLPLDDQKALIEIIHQRLIQR